MEEHKQKVAKELSGRVKDGEIIGVGTGSTVNLALDEIGKRVSAEKLAVSVITTSYQSAWKCEQLGLRVLDSGFAGEVSWGFDGADEVDLSLRLIKGRGGALLREKILAARCRKYVIIVDESKQVKKLGEKCPIPVECVPEAKSVVERALSQLNAKEVITRLDDRIGAPVLTEAGNILIDVRFDDIPNELPAALSVIPGVVEHGIFVGFATEVLVASGDGIKVLGDRMLRAE